MVPLFQAQYAGTSFSTAYTASSATVIDKLTATNTSLTDATVTVALVQLGDSANNGNTVLSVSVPAGQAYLCGEAVGHVLAVGDFIAIKASVSGALVLRASGRTQ